MFYIISQGERITTPIDKLLRPRIVEEVSGITSVSAIKEERLTAAEEQIKNYQLAGKNPSRKRAIYARQIMSSPILGVSVDQLLPSIWAVFEKNGMHHLPVFDRGKKLQGIISDRDLLRFSAKNIRDFDHRRVSEIMTKEVVCAAEKTEIRSLAEVMCRQAIGAVLIVDEKVDVTGIVTRTDILRTVVHQEPLELWT
jgi:acetoin utilization protein AcuB